MEQDRIDIWVVRGLSGLLRMINQEREGKGYSPQVRRVLTQFQGRINEILSEKIESDFFKQKPETIDAWLAIGFTTVADWIVERLEKGDTQPGFVTNVQAILRRVENAIRDRLNTGPFQE